MSLLQDVRFAVRLLIKDKWFTLVAITALALGLGANNAVFTFVNAVLIRGLPFDDPDRIMAVGALDARGRTLGVSRLDFDDFREGSRAFSALSMFLPTTVNVSDEGRPPDQFQGSYGSANMFQVIGQRAQIGRDFGTDDDRPGAEPVVILGDGIWKNRYGSDPSVVGRTIKVNSLASTVIGIMPPDMKFPANNDVWLPLSQLPPEIRNAKRGVRNFQAFGRLGPGVTAAQARSELDNISGRLAREFPETNKDIRPTVMTFNERQSGPEVRLIFLSLMGAVAFVLLIACANVANLLLARSASRSREIAVRVSLGASRWRIVRQLLVESLLLALAAGAVGFGLSVFGVRLFDAITSDVGKPYWMKFTMDRTVLAFLAVVCVGTGVLFGLAPALHVSRTDVNEVMKEAGGRSGTGGMRARRWTSALIVLEIVLTLVLLAGAGFMMRSFMALYGMDLGFDTSRLLTMQLYLPLTKFPKPEPRVALFQRIEERLRGISAVQAGALTTNPPLSGGFLRQLELDGRPVAAGDHPPEVTMVSVSAGYFDVLGLRTVRGRGFTAIDGTAGHESAIINQRFAAMHFAGEDAIGRHIRLIDAAPGPQPSPPVEASIVGIVPTVRQRDFAEPDPDPVVYLPYRADPQRFIVLVVSTQADPGTVTALIREEMRAIEPDLPLFRIQTMEQMLAVRRWPFRVFGTMFAIFAAIALVLSAVGLYAVTAYSVTQRTSEIGVRMALGAQSPQVMWLVLRRGLVQLAIGLPIGIAGAFGVGRLMQILLVQTSARDPVTIGSIAVLMTAISVGACLWPARRATQLDPLKALRYE
ncbi:MAG TPA: ABC transporter permease [Vicinamibacterales bacterium]|jgi:predicted permease|nr:ABC transporter permease [Vicinamibacterales bacterium]